MQRKRTPECSLSPRRWLGLLALTLLVAAVLRLWGLPGVPPGPHYDEAANCILTAEIVAGEKTPLFITSYTGKEVLFFYAAAAMMRLLGTGLAALRLTGALAGLLTVAATAWLVYELFADDEPAGAPWLALLAAAMLATSFWHVLLSRLGFRAVSQPLLQALTLAALWRGLRLGPPRRDLTGASPGWLLLAGLFCGLTGYTYLAARAFPLPLAVALLVLLLGRRLRRVRWSQLGLFALAACVSFAPLGLYFLQHPGTFTNRISQVGPSSWRAAADGLTAAFKMLFLEGDPYIRFNLPGRPLLGPVLAGLFFVGLAATAWRFFRPRSPLAAAVSPALVRAREALLLAWVPLMLLPTALAVGEITPSNLRAVGLIPLIFLLPARGLWLLLDSAGRRIGLPAARYLYTAALALLLLAAGLGTARVYWGAYAPRTDLYEASDGDLAAIAHYLNEADLEGSTAYVGSIHYRHPTVAFLAQDYTKIRWLVGAGTVVYPASGTGLYLFPRSAVPDAAWLARYLPGATPVSVPLAPDGAPAFTGYQLSGPPSAPGTALADFGGAVRLLDYQVAQAVSGSDLDVTILWQILAPPPYPDLLPFYHLVDGWGALWGQAEPFQYAAEDWTPGEIIVSRVHLPVLPGTPPGDYTLRAGVYSPGAGRRLPRTGTDGSFAGTTAPLAVTLTRAETPPDASALDIRRPLDLETRAPLALLGMNLDTAQARPGERVYVTLFWQAGGRGAGVREPLPDYSVDLQLQGGDGALISLYNGAPVHGSYPTGRWHAGEVVVDRYDPRLPLAADELPPGEYTLTLTLTGPDGEPALGPVALGTLTVAASERSFDVPDMAHSQRAGLGEQVELLGYDVDPAQTRPGESVALVLYWRARAEMDTSYTVFVHVLGPDGQIAAQQDNIPVRDTYPTTLWLPNEVVADPYEILLPADLAPGDYPVQVGLYVAENGLRLGAPVVLNTTINVSP